MFMITQGSGFQLTLGNGWTVSVQFGAGNYASNRAAGFPAAKTIYSKSTTAEIAAWHGEWTGTNTSNWYNFGNDKVKGWCTTDEVVTFLGMVSKLPSRKLTAMDYEDSRSEVIVAPTV